MGFENNYFSSKAIVENDYITDINHIIKKADIVDDFRKNYESIKIIAIGDGSNDVEMVKKSDIGIAFGGVREVAPSLKKAADFVTLSENELYELLMKIEEE